MNNTRVKTVPEGLEKVMRNLNKEIREIRGRTMKGLIESAIIIRRDTEATPPLTPLDLGNLRASFFVVTPKGVVNGASPTFKGRTASEKRKATEMAVLHSSTIAALQPLTSDKKTVEKLYMGYSANYAAAVHEMVGDVKWSRPGSGAKWFEAAIKRNHTLILQTVANNVKSKK